MDLDAVADELYGVPLEQFTPLRTEREREARAAGDRELAAQIKTLRKPSVGAWLANQLVRRHRDQVEPFLALGEGLRQAQATLQGEELRQLSAQRHRLVAVLVRQAGAIVAESGKRMTADTERDIEQTLEAALADPAAAEELLTGRLVAPLEHVGFGGAEAPALHVVPPAPAAPAPAPQKKAERERIRREREERERQERERAVREAQAAVDEARAADERANVQEASAQERARSDAERVEELRRELAEAEERAGTSRRHAAEAREARTRAAADLRVAQRRLDAARAKLNSP